MACYLGARMARITHQTLELQLLVYSGGHVPSHLLTGFGYLLVSRLEVVFFGLQVQGLIPAPGKDCLKLVLERQILITVYIKKDQTFVRAVLVALSPSFLLTPVPVLLLEAFLSEFEPKFFFGQCGTLRVAGFFCRLENCPRRVASACGQL